jgi:hypothetical protein
MTIAATKCKICLSFRFGKLKICLLYFSKSLMVTKSVHNFLTTGATALEIHTFSKKDKGRERKNRLTGEVASGEHGRQNGTLKRERSVSFRQPETFSNIFTLSLRRALNFFRQSTVSCLCTTDATRSRC